MIGRVNENGNIKIKTDKIKYISYASKENEYELKEIDNKKFIVIKSNPDTNILYLLQQYNREVEIEEWKLVNSLLKLNKELPKSKYYEMIDKFYIQDNNIFQLIEDELNEKDIGKIIKWCQEYGLPFLGESGIETGKNKSYKWFGFVNDFKTCIDNNICGFRIGCFLIGIYIIYKTAICGNKLNEIKNGINQEINKKIDKEIIEEYIKKTTKSAQLYYEIEENDKYIMYNMQLFAETLMGAAMYTLQLWICAPNDFILKRCNYCNCHFIAKDPREMYCGNPCNKSNVNKKKTRANIQKK